MDPNLMNLKQRMIKTSIEFIRAQRVYLKVTAPNSRASQTELKEASEPCHLTNFAPISTSSTPPR